MKYIKNNYNFITILLVTLYMTYINTNTIKFFNKLIVILFLSIISMFVFFYIIEYTEHFAQMDFEKGINENTSISVGFASELDKEYKDVVIVIAPFKDHKRVLFTKDERIMNQKKKNIYKKNNNVDNNYKPKKFIYDRKIKKKEKNPSLKKRQMRGNNNVYGRMSNDKKLQDSLIYHDRNKYADPMNKGVTVNRLKKIGDRNKDVKITKNAEKIINKHDKMVENDISGTYSKNSTSNEMNIDNLINDIIEEDEKQDNNKLKGNIENIELS